ncbi:MAG: hypothetical protein V1773_09815 [bacterium]
MKYQMELSKEKILALIINYIEKKGITTFTNCKIEEITKVKIADINYLFGSKEQLLEEVLEILLYYTQMFELY